jgi:hypothetical protein
MNGIRISEFNFKKILLESEIENKTHLNEILFNNDLMKKLHDKTYEAHKIKINQDCNKHFADIHYFSRQAKVSEEFEIHSIPFPGKEKHVELLKKRWKSCVDKIKDMQNEKNNSIKNIIKINHSFLMDCIEDCGDKHSYAEGKKCVLECYDFHKINTKVSAKIMADVLLKYINDLNIIYDK